MKLVFFGTPDFAIPSLHALHESRHNILVVVTSPDKKSGRGLKIKSPAVKIEAEKLGYPILQPDDLKNNNFVSTIRNTKADIYVVVAFKILPESVLNIPKQGAVNLHASLLPKYRGAAPVTHAILNGEPQTGVTTFLIQRKVDRGDILLQDTLNLTNTSTAGEVLIQLSNMGAELLVKTLDGILENSIVPEMQDHESATSAPKIEVEDCRINWSNSGKDIHNQIRAFTPIPGAFTFLSGKRVKLFNSRILKNDTIPALNPGEIGYVKPYLLVGTITDTIQIHDIQLEGKKRISASQFISGQPKIIGGNFG